MIDIFIPGKPRGKERSRSRIVTSKKNGKQFTTHYTPKSTRDYESLIASYGIGAMKGRRPVHGPVKLELVICFPVPDSWPKWKTEMALANRILPTVKPDSDNVEKSIKDGLNGVVWHDDCQVVDTVKVKVYREIPGIRVRVTELEKYPAQIKRADIKNENQEALI